MSDEFIIAKLGEPVLRQPAVAVTDFSDASLSAFVDRMLGAMIKAGGVGIAAPQVFDNRRIMIIASKPNPRYPNAPAMAPLVMINPVVKQFYGEKVADWEGCLSVPGIRGLVARFDKVDVSFNDVSGQTIEMTLDGFVARIFAHEFDHLEGRTFVDAVKSPRHLIAETLLPKVLSGDIVLEF